MKRTAKHAVLLLLFTITIGVQLIASPLANFKPSPFPGTPDTEKPSIIIQEPVSGETYGVEQITYNITIQKPEWHGGTYLFSFGYMVDGEENVTLAPNENQTVPMFIYDPSGTFFIPNPDYVVLPIFNQSFKGNLSELPEGRHTVQFWVNALSQYTPEEERYVFPYPVYENLIHAESDLVSFYVAGQENARARISSSDQFSWLPVAAAVAVVAVVVAVSAMMYLKKHRGDNHA